MIAFFANLFGYVLNFLYGLIGNYGLAIILFSILVKLLMLPISISQQKSMKKSQKVNEEMKQIKFKYKNDPETMNKEVMALYKREKMNPMSGCFSAIIQIILLFAVFYLVRSPLTHMKKVDPEIIQNAIEVVEKNGSKSNYKEIEVINYVNNLEEVDSSNEENDNTENADNEEVSADENKEEINENETSNNNNESENKEFDIRQYKDLLSLNMNLFGIDLSKVPTQDLGNIKVLIIPILYVISSFVSIRLSTNMNKKNKEKQITDGSNENSNPEENSQDFADSMDEANKRMSFLMPIMSITIAMVAPLGLALYWLMNNILMIIERVVLNKIIKD